MVAMGAGDTGGHNLPLGADIQSDEPLPLLVCGCSWPKLSGPERLPTNAGALMNTPKGGILIGTPAVSIS